VTRVKKVNVTGAVVFLVALAAALAKAKWGYGFSSGR